MMKLNLKQTLVALMLIATLLAALAVGILRIEAARSAPATPHSTHSLAWYCPPPPVVC
jgi:hypothetical protein